MAGIKLDILLKNLRQELGEAFDENVEEAFTKAAKTDQKKTELSEDEWNELAGSETFQHLFQSESENKAEALLDRVLDITQQSLRQADTRFLTWTSRFFTTVANLGRTEKETPIKTLDDRLNEVNQRLQMLLAQRI